MASRKGRCGVRPTGSPLASPSPSERVGEQWLQNPEENAEGRTVCRASNYCVKHAEDPIWSQCLVSCSNMADQHGGLMEEDLWHLKL